MSEKEKEALRLLSEAVDALRSYRGGLEYPGAGLSLLVLRDGIEAREKALENIADSQ